MVSDLPGVSDAGASVQRVAGAAVVEVTAVILAQRLRRADPARRHVLVPLFAYGIVAVLFIPVSTLIQPLLGFSSGTLTVLQLIVIGGVPIAFALGVLRGGFARTGEVEELGTWLGVSGGARPTLNEALAQTLGDPTLQLAFWASDRNAYVDSAGRSVDLPSPGSDRAVAEVDLEGRPVGAIIYDATLIDDPELVRAAGRVVAIAVDRERLTAQLLASEAALRESRERPSKPATGSADGSPGICMTGCRAGWCSSRWRRNASPAIPLHRSLSPKPPPRCVLGSTTPPESCDASSTRLCRRR